MNSTNQTGRTSTLERIAGHLSEMTPVSRRIGEYILQHPETAVRLSISQLARHATIRSESSVVRFYQALGYTGYHDFKVSLASDIAGKTFVRALEDIDGGDNPGTIKRKLFDGCIRTLQQNANFISDDILDRAVRLITEAKRLIILGYGSSAAIASDACFKFSRLGVHCIFSPDSHLNAIVLSESRQGDVILAISHSGESRDIVTPLRALSPGVKVVSLTGEQDSSLSKIADVNISIFSEEQTYRTDALISRILQSTVVSVLYTSVAVRLDESLMEKLFVSRRALSYLKF